MANVLKIIKPDGTVHTTPTRNQSFYESYNRRLKPAKRWKMSIITEEEAKNLSFKDPNYVKPGDQAKVIDQKDREIERLQSMLAKLQKAGVIDASEADEILKGTGEDDIDPGRPIVDNRTPQQKRKDTLEAKKLLQE